MARKHALEQQPAPYAVNGQPYKRLACAVFARACRDLRDGDLMTKLDALLWITVDGQAWLEMLDLADLDGGRPFDFDRNVLGRGIS